MQVLQCAAAELLPILETIFNSSIELGHCPKQFRSSITVALRKPGKEDYTSGKSYRLVALLNTIGKILDAIIAKRISYIAETYELLPKTHLGGRKASSTDHTAHLLVEKVQAGWNASAMGGVTTVLCLNVSGAFDYVSHSRLLHNLRKRCIDDKTVQWISSFLDSRSTSIRLSEYISENTRVNTGIPQGSPISPILYLFYNADLLDVCESTELKTSAIGYIDDISLITASDSAETNCQRLAAIYTYCQDWERKHAFKFNPAKYSLIHIPRRGTRKNAQYALELPGLAPIQPEEQCRYLGIILDTKLAWDQHIKHIQSRTAKSLEALASLAGSTWGTSNQGPRQYTTP